MWIHLVRFESKPFVRRGVMLARTLCGSKRYLPKNGGCIQVFSLHLVFSISCLLSSYLGWLLLTVYWRDFKCLMVFFVNPCRRYFNVVSLYHCKLKAAILHQFSYCSYYFVTCSLPNSSVIAVGFIWRWITLRCNSFYTAHETIFHQHQW